MGKIAARGVRYGNFHTTALCSPTRACLLTGRNATSNGMATIAEFTAGFPGFNARIPFENGFISEVLNGQGWNTYAVGKWHLTPGDESNVSAWKGRWPLGRGFERFYGFLSGEASSWYPDLIADNSPVDRRPGPRTGTTSPRTCRTRPSSSSATARSSTRTSRSSCTSRRRPATPPTTCRSSGPSGTRAASTQGYEAIRTEILARQIELGLLPARHDADARSTPTASPTDGPRRPALAPARHGAALGHRCPTTSSDCSPGWPRSSPGTSPTPTTSSAGSSTTSRSPAQLDNTLIVVISDNGASGEGGPDGTFNEWRFFNGAARPAPT